MEYTEEELLSMRSAYVSIRAIAPDGITVYEVSTDDEQSFIFTKGELLGLFQLEPLFEEFSNRAERILEKEKNYAQ